MNWSIFDVIGPIMIGPSSSHTAGASRIGYIGFLLNKGIVKKARITLYGSFAKVYQGHGSDWAIVGGLLGMESDDRDLTKAYEIAKKIGADYEIIFDTESKVEHPNTVKVEMFDSKELLNYVAISVGAGSISIDSINGVKVQDLDCRDSKVIYIGNNEDELSKAKDHFVKNFGKYRVDFNRKNFVLQASINSEDRSNYNNTKLILIPKF